MLTYLGKRPVVQLSRRLPLPQLPWPDPPASSPRGSGSAGPHLVWITLQEPLWFPKELIFTMYTMIQGQNLQKLKKEALTWMLYMLQMLYFPETKYYFIFTLNGIK